MIGELHRDQQKTAVNLKYSFKQGNNLRDH